MRRTKILLVFPPVGDPTRPYLSLPQTKAVLAARGFLDVCQRDYNLRSYLYYLDRGRLERTLEHVIARLGMLDRLASLDAAQSAEYAELAKASLVLPFVTRNIGGALSVLRDPVQCAIPERYLAAMSVFERALQAVSAEYFPTQWYSFAFRMRFSPESPEQILAALEAERDNPFLEFYREAVLPELAGVPFDVIRIVVAYQNQIIPALTLAKLIRKASPGIHLNLGGVTTSYHVKRLAQWPELASFIDSMTIDAPIPFEGECGGDLAFAELLERMEAGAHGCFLVNPSAEVDSLAYQPPPDFDGLPLDQYLSPVLVLPYATSRGCHWGRCAFCFHTGKYVERAADAVVSDLATLSAKYHTRYFYFADDAVSPEMLARVSERLAGARLNILWHCMIRPEAGITAELARSMAAAGCRSAFVGVESANRRVLKLMKKGTTPEILAQVLRNLHAAGIAVRVFCMIGLPTETREEAGDTLRFLLAEREAIQDVRCQIFRVEKDTEMARRPQKFGIRTINDDPNRPLAYELETETEGGMSRDEIRAFQKHFERSCNEAFHRWNRQATFFGFSHSSHSLFRSCHAEQHSHSQTAVGQGLALRRAPSPPLFGRPERPAQPEGLPHAPAPAVPESSRAAMKSDCSSTSNIPFSGRVPTVGGSVTMRRFPFDVRSVLEQPAELPALVRGRERSWLYAGETDQILPLSPAVQAILDQCNGQTRIADITARFPAEARERILELVRSLAERRVITLS